MFSGEQGQRLQTSAEMRTKNRPRLTEAQTGLPQRALPGGDGRPRHRSQHPLPCYLLAAVEVKGFRNKISLRRLIGTNTLAPLC